MKRFALILFLSLVFASPSYSLTPWPAPNEPGNLAVTVVASGSVKYLRDWVDPSMRDKVTIQRISEVKVGQIAYCGFIITGLSPSPKPVSRLKYSVGFNFYGPNGDLVFSQPEYARGQLDDPKKPIFIMADPALDLGMEASDSAGKYILEGIVTDLNTNKKASSKYEITLIK